jgi:hypothetical protein
MQRKILFALVLSAGLSSPGLAGEWPQWRGPDGQGHATGKGFPLTWSEKQNVTWKTELPGRGWSSPVVWGEQIWLTAALEIPASPEKAKERLKADATDQPHSVLDEVRLHALCVDRKSGRLLHDIELITVRDPQWVHEQNSYATPTPVIGQGRVWCHFGTFGTACVDTTSGQVLWKNTDLHLNHEHGPGGSPVLWKNLLIFHGDGSDVQFVAALEKETGKLAWKTARSAKLERKPLELCTYSTPLLLEFASGPQLISTGPDWLYGYDPASGKELWKLGYDTQGFAMSSRPVAGGGRIFFSTGFYKPVLQVVRHDGSAQPVMDWGYAKGVPTMSSPLLVDDLIFFIGDSGILTCVTTAKGKQAFRERLDGRFLASPTLADGRVYIPSAEGKTYVVPSDGKFELLATAELEGRQMATPAAVDGVFFIRTEKALYRIENPGK